MNQTRKDIDEMLCEAVEIESADQRQAYLDAACGEDTELRSRLEKLVADHFGAGEFLEEPAICQFDPTFDFESISEGPHPVIGRYKLLQEIGTGGMGVVYMAEQQEPVRRRVALKVIKPGMDTRAVVARFEAERQALAMMDHPNIAHVLDGGATESGRPYFVMDLVNGIRITDYCDENQLTTRERLELFAMVCHAVQHAHHKGIIHRDLKPSNVLVTLHDGVPVPRIIDFGIAKAIHQHLTDKTLFTGHGEMIGTPLYMSPEQAEVSGLDVDTRSDIYSLGVLLYELLTGTTPVSKEQLRKAGVDEIRRMIREDEPRQPSERISTLGAAATTISAHRKTDPAKLSQVLRRDLDWIVMKALQKDRRQRYETASDFARDIQRYLADEPIEARPPTLADRLAKWGRRHRPLVVSAAVLLVLCTIGSLVSVLLIAQEREKAIHAYEEKNAQLQATERAEKLAKRQEQVAKQQERLAREQAKLAKEQKDLAEAQKEEATRQRDISDRNLYVAHMRLAAQDWETGQINRLHRLLDSHAPQHDRQDLRGWEWYYYLSLCHGELMTLRGHSGPVQCVVWSPDGSCLATAGSDRTVRIWNGDTGKEIRTLSAHQDVAKSVAWSPDGKRLASGGRDGTAKVWDVATGAETRTFRGLQGAAASVAWSPDGKRLAVATRISDVTPGTVIVWDITSGREVLNLDRRGDSLVAWSPDGKRLVTGTGGEWWKFKTWDAESGQELHTFQTGADGVFALSWSPDGRRVACGEQPCMARIWDATTGNNSLSLRHPGTVYALAWEPQGRQIAAACQGGGITLWDSTSGEKVHVLGGHRGERSSVAWSPDGTQLASAGDDGTVKIWDPRRKRNPKTMNRAQPIDGDGAPCLAWSPKGDRLFSGGIGRGIRVWNPATGDAVQSLEMRESAVDITVSPDASRLAVATPLPTLIVDARSGKNIVKTLPAGITSWSPDGKRLACSHFGSNSVRVLDTTTGQQVLVRNGPAEFWTCGVAWSPDGSRVASTGPGVITIWDAATGADVLTLRGHQDGCPIRCVAWSPDGKRLASGGYEATVIIWDADDGHQLQTLVGHAGVVYAVAWSADGKRLASVSADRTVRVWDPASGDELFSVLGVCLAWSPDGQQLATLVDRDGTIRLYDASIGYSVATNNEP